MNTNLTTLYQELKNLASARAYSNTLFRIGNVKERARFKNSIAEMRLFYDTQELDIKKRIEEAKVTNNKNGERTELVTKVKYDLPVVANKEQPQGTCELVTEFKNPVKLVKPELPKIISPEKPKRQVADLRIWQQSTATLVFDAIVGNIVDSRDERYNACLIEASTGSGKTYMVGNVIARLVEIEYFKDWPAAYHTMVVTKANVVEQFKRDLQYQFGVSLEDGVLVTNYDQLRSNFGANIIERQIKILYGNEIEVFRWHRFLHPRLVIWDECHSLKNEGSTQSKIGQALNDLEEGKVFQIHMSATPATRIADLKCFTVACRAPMY